MGSTRPSMQELIGRLRRAGFVGRVEERAAFRRNLQLPPEDERHRFLFHVHGPAGVGKTRLVRELEQIAREAGALTAYVDEGAAGVPEAMAALAGQFDRALALQPDGAWGRCERGDALRVAGRDGEALADYDRALELDPEYAYAYASRGVSLSNLGRHEEGLTDLDHAIALQPDYPWALEHRAAIRQRSTL